MSDIHQLLMTKLATPAAQPWLISRSRLLARLAEARSRLTLLSAPAGFGKSALLNDWLHTSHQSSHASTIAWLILDEADNDPLRFWTYLGTLCNTFTRKSAQPFSRVCKPLNLLWRLS